MTNGFKGKAIVYHIPQDTEDVPTPDSLNDIRSQTDTIRSETSALNVEVKNLKAQLAAMGSVVSMTDLRTSISNLEAEKASMTSRIEVLRAQNQVKAEEGQSTSVMDEQAERKRVEDDIKAWQAILGRRTAIQKAMWDVVGSMMPEGQSEADWKVSRLCDCLHIDAAEACLGNEANSL